MLHLVALVSLLIYGLFQNLIIHYHTCTSKDTFRSKCFNNVHSTHMFFIVKLCKIIESEGMQHLLFLAIEIFTQYK